ncbi:nucleotidyltransferase family protein [Diplocloster modestus]|uniref:GTP pyrophosphokinase n=1 Tax=Diplocloster modestus TaxID=2850322 RepID=A0ABS6K5I7_9FIRM|nr:GTP pyrophosphokinase [Diplocloster modestus]
MRVEIQLRTVAMNFWATLEHQIKYNSKSTKGVEIVDALRDCADTIADTDKRMLQIREYTDKEK